MISFLKYEMIRVYASTLETLTVLGDREVLTDFACYGGQFTKLRELTLGEKIEKPFDLLRSFSCPELKSLCILRRRPQQSHLWQFGDVLQQFPKLVDLKAEQLPLFPDLIYSVNDESQSAEASNTGQLKSLVLYGYYPNFILSQQQTLTDLRIKYVSLDDIQLLLRDLQGLKSLEIACIKEGIGQQTAQLPINSSIERLKVEFVGIRHEELNMVLLALPSLRELHLLAFTVSEAFLKFMSKKFATVIVPLD